MAGFRAASIAGALAGAVALGPAALWAAVAGLIASGRTGAAAVIGPAFAAVVTGEIGVTIDGWGIRGPCGQEKLFQVQVGFGRGAHWGTVRRGTRADR